MNFGFDLSSVPLFYDFIWSEEYVCNRFDSKEECPICLESLEQITPPHDTSPPEFGERYDWKLLRCSAGHAFHSHCLIGAICSPTDEREFNDRCPTCRRRLFADVDHIEDRKSTYVRKELESKDACDRPAESSADTPTPTDASLHHSWYARGLEAWTKAAETVRTGDIDLFTETMNAAEELDEQIERMEERMEESLSNQDGPAAEP